jgi:hypothetical protein
LLLLLNSHYPIVCQVCQCQQRLYVIDTDDDFLIDFDSFCLKCNSRFVSNATNCCNSGLCRFCSFNSQNQPLICSFCQQKFYEIQIRQIFYFTWQLSTEQLNDPILQLI